MTDKLMRRGTITLVGLVFIVTGVVMTAKSSLGTSPIVSTPYALSFVITSISFGTLTILFNIILITLQLILIGKNIKKETWIIAGAELGMSLIFGVLTDIGMKIFENFSPEGYFFQVLTMVFGIILIAFGVYLQLVSKLTLIPGDGFAYALTLRVKKKYSHVRMASDTTMMVIAALIGVIGTGHLVGVREGTVISCLLTGPIARWYLAHFKKLSDVLVPENDTDNL